LVDFYWLFLRFAGRRLELISLKYAALAFGIVGQGSQTRKRVAWGEFWSYLLVEQGHGRGVR
jgi:hypothetical protein